MDGKKKKRGCVGCLPVALIGVGIVVMVGLLRPTESFERTPTWTPTVAASVGNPLDAAPIVELATATAQAQPVVDTKPHVLANTTINVRGGPGTDYPAVGSLDAGARADVVGKNSGAPSGPDWWMVALANGQVGWVFAELVTTGGDVGGVNVVAGYDAPPAAAPARSQPIEVGTPLGANAAPQAQCDPSYPDVCIAPNSPDLNCGDVPHKRFRVLPPDPHGFDTDQDGIGCEN